MVRNITWDWVGTGVLRPNVRVRCRKKLDRNRILGANSDSLSVVLESTVQVSEIGMEPSSWSQQWESECDRGANSDKCQRRSDLGDKSDSLRVVSEPLVQPGARGEWIGTDFFETKVRVGCQGKLDRNWLLWAKSEIWVSRGIRNWLL